MASLDIEILFTNIPLQKILDNITNDLFFTTDKARQFAKSLM